MKKLQGGLLTALFVLALAAGGLLLFLLPHDSYSEAERRQLASPPVWTVDTLADGRFFDDADRWAADHFAFREFFRTVKAVFQTRVLLENENNGLAVADGSIVRLEKQVNADSVIYAADCFRAICDRYLTGTDCKIYAALIPDKSYFLAERGCPVMKLDDMEALLCAGLPQAQSIAIRDALTLSDYYLTDSHWRQERILPAANALLLAMGRAGDLSLDDFEKQTCAPFYGVYAKQSALDPDPDAITFLTGGPLDGARVLDFSSMSVIPMYDPENCDARDLYTLFLGGPKGFLRIENSRGGSVL